MTIKITQDVRIAGSLVAASDTPRTYAADIEAQLVTDGKAVYFGATPGVVDAVTVSNATQIMLPSASRGQNQTALDAILAAGRSLALNVSGTYNVQRMPTLTSGASVALAAGVVLTDGKTRWVGPKVFSQSPQADYYDGRYPFRAKLSVDRSKISAALTNFPAKFVLPESILTKCAPDGRDLLFASLDGRTQLQHEIVRTNQLSEGIWTWFNNPRAIVNAAGTTFWGWVRTNGDIGVSSLAADGAYTETVLDAALEVDDHNNPGLAFTPDGRIVAAWSQHTAILTHYIAVSSVAGSIAAFGAKATHTNTTGLGTAYSCPFVDSAGVCYVFYRSWDNVTGAGHNGWWSYYTTTDYTTFSAEKKLIQANDQRPYCVFHQTGDRVDILVNSAHPDEGVGSIYHVYVTLTNGTATAFKTSGAPITPAAPWEVTANATLVFQGTDNTDDAWVWDVIRDGYDNPCALFQRGNSSGSAISLWTSRWNGYTWSTPVKVADMGVALYTTGTPQVSYGAGGCFDGNDPNKVYWCYNTTTDGSTATGELYESHSTDGGATWQLTRQITSGAITSIRNCRPFSPRGHTKRCNVLWWCGSYTNYTTYQAYICIDPPPVVEAYVKLPLADSRFDVGAYLYYGNDAGPDNVAAAGALWDNNHLVVYHMQNDQGSKNVPDATTNGRNAARAFYSQPKASRQGKSATLRNAVGNVWVVNTPVGLNFQALTALTLEAYVYYVGGGATTHNIFTNFDATAFSTSVSARVIFRVDSSTNQLTGFVSRVGDTSAALGGLFGANALTTNAWNHVALVFDSTSLRGYVNGALCATTYANSGGGAMFNNASVAGFLGNRHDGTGPFAGHIAEFRASNVARSAAYIAAQYEAMKNNDTFWRIAA